MIADLDLWAPRLALFVVASYLAASVWVLLAHSLLRGARALSARARHLVLAGTMLGLAFTPLLIGLGQAGLALPALKLTMERSDVAPPVDQARGPAEHRQDRVAASARAFEPSLAAEGSVLGIDERFGRGPKLETKPQSAATPDRRATPSRPWLTFLCASIFIGWFAFFFRRAVILAGQLCAMRGLWRRASAPVGSRLPSILERVCCDRKLARVPELRIGVGLPAPTSFGLRHGRILWPADLLDVESLAARAALEHEVAHLVRRDTLWGMVQQVAVLWYGRWPGVAALHRALDEARESLCDDQVSRRNGATRALAELLVRCAERRARLPHGAMSLLPHDQGLEGRVRRLLEGKEPIMIGISARTRIASFTGFVSVATMVAATAVHLDEPHSSQAIQDEEPVRGERQEEWAGTDARSFFPVGRGASWTYRRTWPEGLVQEQTLTAIGHFELDGGEAALEFEWSGNRDGFEYWRVREDGLWRFHNQYLGGMRGADSRTPPTPVLLTPLAVDHAWTWTELGSIQVSGDTEFPSDDELRIHFEAEIESLDDVVRVPAGEFRATRVRVTSQSRYFGEGTSTKWFAEGVGLVKQVDGTRARPGGVLELVDTVVGAEFAVVDPDAVLRRHLSESGLHAVENGVQRLDHAAVKNWFESRFYRVKFGGFSTGLFRVHGDRVTAFDPKVKEHWNGMLADEPRIVGASSGPSGWQAVEQVARACAFLLGVSAEGDGWPRIQIPGSKVSSDPDGTWEVSLKSQNPEKTWSRAVVMQIRDGQVADLQLTYSRR